MVSTRIIRESEPPWYWEGRDLRHRGTRRGCPHCGCDSFHSFSGEKLTGYGDDESDFQDYDDIDMISDVDR